jgi:hypothetical protein
MTHENDGELLKKIRKLLDEHVAKEKPVEVPILPLPKPEKFGGLARAAASPISFSSAWGGRTVTATASSRLQKCRA